MYVPRASQRCAHVCAQGLNRGVPMNAFRAALLLVLVFRLSEGRWRLSPRVCRLGPCRCGSNHRGQLSGGRWPVRALAGGRRHACWSPWLVDPKTVLGGLRVRLDVRSMSGVSTHLRLWQRPRGPEKDPQLTFHLVADGGGSGLGKWGWHGRDVVSGHWRCWHS